MGRSSSAVFLTAQKSSLMGYHSDHAWLALEGQTLFDKAAAALFSARLHLTIPSDF